MDNITIRKANRNDFVYVNKLIEELKLTYKKTYNSSDFSFLEQEFISHGFGKNPLFEILLARDKKEVLGMAFYSFCYDSFRGKSIYLDTLIVSESNRGKGIGKKIFKALLKEALDNKVNALFWEVLKTNEKAIDFYKSLKAEFSHFEITCRLSKENIRLL